MKIILTALILTILLVSSKVQADEIEINNLGGSSLYYTLADGDTLFGSADDVYCDVCGKLMTHEAENGYKTQLVGMTVEVIDWQDDPEITEFFKDQMYPYQHNKKYRICYSDWLYSLGIKE